MPASWSKEEVEVIVQDYLSMLESEILSLPYNKAEHRRALMKNLNNRSEGSIERKHQNISAVMLALGMPYINGYKPLGNYQNLLFESVSELISSNPRIQEKLDEVVNSDVAVPSVDNILRAMVAPPEPRLRVQTMRSEPRIVHFGRVNYLRKEAQNQRLGLAGELFVVNFEKAYLIYSGKTHLAENIEHTSVSKGDGAGFDIHSYNLDGSDKFIEAKTTRFGQYTPFFATRNEVDFSARNPGSYWLYRVFQFQENPKLFAIKGSLEDRFVITPIQYLVNYCDKRITKSGGRG
ncbi:MAG: DUF3883 domain-containing protein [Thermovirgaceae bacterium]|jgi:hypothetical protein